MFQAPSSLYMVYCIPYMEVTKGKKKKAKQNEVDTKTVKIATSEIRFSILKRNFTIYCKRTFLHHFLRGITYQFSMGESL